MDIDYKTLSDTFTEPEEKLNSQNIDTLSIQNEEEISTILTNLSQNIEINNQDEILSSLKNLKQKKELDFTLQVVKHFKLFENLMILTKKAKEEIQNDSIAVLNLALNWQTIQHSVECDVISFLIYVINTNNMITGFIAIQSLSKIAAYNFYYHDRVIFQLSALDVLQTRPPIEDSESNNEAITIEYVEEKCRSGKRRYIPYKDPGILPGDEIEDTEVDAEHLILMNLLQNFTSYIKYQENNEDHICIPSLNLISSLLKFELHPIIISYCLESLISLIPISNDTTLEIVLEALCQLSKQNKMLWNKAFQSTNPPSWIAPLFESDQFKRSFKIAELLMFFVSNTIKQGITIEGMPIDILIYGLQYDDEKSIIATYSAAAIDSILKLHNNLIDSFIQHNLLVVTNDVYPNLSFSAKALMVSYLTRICQYGSSHHKKMIIEIKLVSFLVNVLLTDFANDDLLLRIILSLIEIFEYAKKHKEIYDLCYKQVVDDVSSIRDFQYHEKQTISFMANKFLNKYFDGIDDNEYDDDDYQLFNF